MQKGDYYGMGPDHLNKDSQDNDKKITPAMAYIPRGIDNSTGGLNLSDNKRFGPLGAERICWFELRVHGNSWYQILRNDDADYNRDSREPSFPAMCQVFDHKFDACLPAITTA